MCTPFISSFCNLLITRSYSHNAFSCRIFHHRGAFASLRVISLNNNSSYAFILTYAFSRGAFPPFMVRDAEMFVFLLEFFHRCIAVEE